MEAIRPTLEQAIIRTGQALGRAYEGSDRQPVSSWLRACQALRAVARSTLVRRRTSSVPFGSDLVFYFLLRERTGDAARSFDQVNPRCDPVSVAVERAAC